MNRKLLNDINNAKNEDNLIFENLKSLKISYRLNNKTIGLALVLSCFFSAANFLSLDWYPLPWIDEVCFADTSINFVLKGEWISTVWKYSYNPLHAFLLIPWLFVFGISHVSVTSINIVFAFILCFLLSSFLNKKQIVTSNGAMILFVTLFWNTEVLSWNFRCGRVDPLIMIFTFLVIRECLDFKAYEYTNSFRYLKLFVYSFLLFLSGVPSLPVIITLIIFLYVIQQNHRRTILKIGLYSLLAFVSCFAFVCVFYGYNHSLRNYLNSFIIYNTNTNTAIVKSESFFLRLKDAYLINKEALYLTIGNIIIFLYYYWGIRKKNRNDSFDISKLTYFLLFILSIPIIMTLAGRYPVYYSWMFFLPTLILSIFFFDNLKSLLSKILFILIFFFCIAEGFPKSLIQADRHSKGKMDMFISKQPVTENSLVISDFLPYYQLKHRTKNLFIPVMYNSLIPDSIEYIFVAPQSYGTEALSKFKEIEREKGKTVFTIDSIDSPKIVAYKISKAK